MRLHRQFYWLLIPLFLVLAQQAQSRHEYSEHSLPVGSQKKGDADRCETCFALDQVAGIATTHVPTAVLLSGLAFERVGSAPVAVVDFGVVIARSRGPPVLSIL